MWNRTRSLPAFFLTSCFTYDNILTLQVIYKIIVDP